MIQIDGDKPVESGQVVVAVGSDILEFKAADAVVVVRVEPVEFGSARSPFAPADPAVAIRVEVDELAGRSGVLIAGGVVLKLEAADSVVAVDVQTIEIVRAEIPLVSGDGSIK